METDTDQSTEPQSQELMVELVDSTDRVIGVAFRFGRELVEMRASNALGREWSLGFVDVDKFRTWLRGSHKRRPLELDGVSLVMDRRIHTLGRIGILFPGGSIWALSPIAEDQLMHHAQV